MFAAFCCARCGRSVRVLGCYRGKTVRCPGCAIRLVVPATLTAEQPAPSPPDPFGRPKVHTAPANLDVSTPPTTPCQRQVRWAWTLALLLPALLAFGLPLWFGYGMLWPGLGVGLAAVCLLVGQWGRWPPAARVSLPFCLALLGHGLALHSWLLSSASPLLVASSTADSPGPPNPAARPIRGGSASLSPIFPMMARPSLGPISPSGIGVAPGPEFQTIGNIGPLLAATFGPNEAGKGSAFVTKADGLLKRFSYPEFQPQATYRLDRPAYRAVQDERRGRLWAAVSAPAALRVSRRGDRPGGRGDLHVYDVPHLPDKSPTQAALRPRRVLALDGNVTELLADPDRSRLYYLARTHRGVHLGRIDADKEELDAELALPPETHALCLTPDGKTLYAGGGGVVSVIDSATLRVRRSLDLDGDIWSVAADNAGRVYVARQGQWTDVTLLDLSAPQPAVHRWSATLHGRVYLKLGTDQSRLYASSSSLLSNLLEVLLVQRLDRIPPPQVGVVPSNDRRLVGGEFFLSPDGQILVSCRGHVFRLASGANLNPNSRPQSVPPILSRRRGEGRTSPPE